MALRLTDARCRDLEIRSEIASTGNRVRLLTADLFALAIKRVLLVLISENSWTREETVLA